MISCLIQNIHEEEIASLFQSSDCEKCCHIKIVKFYNILGQKGPHGIA